MKVSVCITTKNEKKEDIYKLLDSLSKQTLTLDEVIIVDADKNSKIPKLKNSKQFKNLKIINSKNVSRAEGRNLAIKMAKNEIIAITDVGCVPRKDWLEKLVLRFHSGRRSSYVVAGGYKMIARNNFQKACSNFLGVKQKDMNDTFMPSARSMAFTKTIWKKAGGFPEKLENTAEDTLFNVNLIKAGAKFAVQKNAIVEWGMPNTVKSFYLKVKNYATGDAESGIWWHPIKRFQSHNIKIVSIYLRYIIGLLLLVFSFKFFVFTLLLYILITLYLSYSYKKAGTWGPILQIVSDFAVMTGFLRGILKSCVKI